MTIKNLKQIAIKYATTKGSRVPLAPDELCNAVVQYFNEFLKITADINTIQVAVTEEGGNIVFTITGNTLDGKAFTPIVITVDHNDFVTNQEFEEFKTSVTEQLNNKLNKITSPISNFVLYANINGHDTQISYASGPKTNSILYRDVTGKTAVVKGVSGQDVANMENLSDITAKINSTLNNKLDKVSSATGVPQVYVKEYNGTQTMIDLSESTRVNSIPKRSPSGRMYTNDGISSEPSSVANMRNIADVEAKIPDVSNFATKDDLSEKLDTSGGTISGNLTVLGNINTSAYESRGVEVIDLDISNTRVDVGNANYNINILSSNRPTVAIGNNTVNIALENDIPKYTSVDSVIYDATNGVIIAYNGANEIHIPLLAGENVTIAASEDNKKIVISAAGGGGAGDVTAAGNNIFTGENEFRNYTYDTSYFCFVDTKEDYLSNGYTTTIKNGSFDISYYENGEGKYWTTYADNQIINKDIDMEGEVVIKFPKKGGTFALTSDIIKNPIYFISFYANEPSEPCYLIGTMMSKNSYGTGQKTNEEFAVMLADNLYVNSNEGLAAYGRLAEKDILCIYSEDGLSIRCLNEENSEVDLPTVMFFVMETEL